MSLLESVGKLRVRALALLAAVFVAGVLAGFGLARALRPRHHLPPPLAMFDQLDLTPEQHQKVDGIFQLHRPELETILGESRPKVRAIQATIEREVRAVLTAEQQSRLDVLEAEMRRHGPEGHGHALPPGVEPPPPGAGGPPPPGAGGPPPPGAGGPPPPGAGAPPPPGASPGRP